MITRMTSLPFVLAAFASAAVLLGAGCARQQEAPRASETASPTPAAETAPTPQTTAYVAPAGAAAIGMPMTQANPVHLAAVRADMPAYLSKTVLVEATADRVCQAKGCWMTVKDGDGPAIWVRWGSGCGGAYAFPKDASGRKVIVEGTLAESEITAEQAAHYAGESPGMDAAKITGKTFEINATSCVVLPEAATSS